MADIRKTDVNDRLWSQIAARVNNLGTKQPHPHATGTLSFQPDPRGAIAANMSAEAKWSEMLQCGRTVAKYFSRVTYALYGITGNVSPAYDAYDYFFVDAPWHQAHVTAVETAINAVAPPRPADSEGMRLQQINTYYDAMWGAIYSRVQQTIPDLRVCHGSCHSSCHNSRGRR